MPSCFTVYYGGDPSIHECWGPMNGLPLGRATKFLDHHCQEKMILQRRAKPLSHIRTNSNTLCSARQRVAERMVFQRYPVLPEFFLSKTQCDTYLWDILLTVSREFHQQPNWSCHLELFTLEKGATMRSVITAGDMESIRVGASTLKTAPTISTTHKKTSAEVKTARKSVLNKSSISGHEESRRYITLFNVWFYLVSFMGHQWKCLSERPPAEYVEMCMYTYIHVCI